MLVGRHTGSNTTPLSQEEDVRALLAAISACAGHGGGHGMSATPRRSPRRRPLPADVRRRFAELREGLTAQVCSGHGTDDGRNSSGDGWPISYRSVHSILRVVVTITTL